MMIHAPSSALVVATIDEHDGRRDRAEAVDDRAGPPARLAQPPPVHDHSGLRQRERDEDADHVERDQRVRVAAEDDEQQRAANTLSTTMPFENARRSPWFVNWRGR